MDILKYFLIILDNMKIEDNASYFGTLLGAHNKDIAYHNGCIWPWLTGAFVRSFLKTKKYEEKWRIYAYENFIKPILNPEKQQCVGYIPEIFDGDEPHAPQGCVSQAWSVAEILRTYVEDIMFIRPKYEHTLAKHGLNIPTGKLPTGKPLA
jgi:glycogen debranching enzyme